MDYEELDGTKGIADNFVRWRSGERVYPFFLDYNLTNRCNLDCAPCRARSDGDCDLENELDSREVLTLVEDALSLKVRRFHITGGGEPLVRADDFMSIVRRIKGEGRYCSLVTNGTLFTEAMIRELAGLGFDRILFSINGPNEEIDETLRGRGAFARSIEAVKRFHHYRRSSTSPWLVIAPVLTSSISRRISDFVALCRETGADHLHLQPVLVTKPDYTYLEVDLDGTREELEGAKALAEELSIVNNLGDLTQEDPLCQEEVTCFSPWSTMIVNPEGKINPCPMMGEQGLCESVREKPLSEIWFGEAFTALRRSLHEGKSLSFCRECCGANILFNKKILAEVDRRRSPDLP